MTELLIKQEPTTLPHDVVMLYQVTVFLPNGDIENQYSLSEYSDAREIFNDLGKELPVELTCNIEVWKDKNNSETKYTSIAKNFYRGGVTNYERI